MTDVMRPAPLDQAARAFSPESFAPQETIDPSLVVAPTPLTLKQVKMVAQFETVAWGESGRSFQGSNDQIRQELDETASVWIDVVEGRVSLEDTDTIHHLREEIGDGVIADIGQLRYLTGHDELREELFLRRMINEAARSHRLTAETAVALYLVKGHRLLGRAEQVSGSPSRMSAKDRNEILMALGSHMKSGVEALQLLGADPVNIIGDKLGTNGIKYSLQRLAIHGGMDGAKKYWNQRQLPVVMRKGQIIEIPSA